MVRIYAMYSRTKPKLEPQTLPSPGFGGGRYVVTGLGIVGDIDLYRPRASSVWKSNKNHLSESHPSWVVITIYHLRFNGSKQWYEAHLRTGTVRYQTQRYGPVIRNRSNLILYFGPSSLVRLTLIRWRWRRVQVVASFCGYIKYPKTMYLRFFCRGLLLEKRKRSSWVFYGQVILNLTWRVLNYLFFLFALISRLCKPDT